jgi:hypothetical protein
MLTDSDLVIGHKYRFIADHETKELAGAAFFVGKRSKEWFTIRIIQRDHLYYDMAFCIHTQNISGNVVPYEEKNAAYKHLLKK